MPNRNRILVPGAENIIERFKYEIAQEVGSVPAGTVPADYRQALDQRKWEVAAELGLTTEIQSRGFPNMTARECGRIGGRMGGKIGGQMVKKMIALAESALAGSQ